MKSFPKTVKIWTTLAVMAVLAMTTVSFASSEENEFKDWPREIQAGEATVTVYQPQLESFESDIMAARSAVMVKESANAEPVFGAVWFDARVSTDKETRMVDLLEVKVDAIKFPNISEEQSAQLVDIIETSFGKGDLSFSLDRLLAEMDMVEQEKSLSAKLNNEPPKILYVDYPAVLVMIDGDPIFKEIDGSKYKYMVNTPFFVVHDPSSKRYFLKGGEHWYTSKDVTGDWQTIDDPPKEVVELGEQHVETAQPEEDAQAQKDAEQPADEEASDPGIPQIIVATEPTELIVSNGAPEYAPVEGTELLYMKNSESDILMDIDSQTYYVLISGRWYASKSLTDGKWSFVSAEELPGDFPNIPAGSDMASVLSSVGGTQEARDAVLENQIPQTATVDRKTATVDVSYDGNPEFKRIEDTNVSYAVNTDKSVLHIDGKYYCCDNAVWFMADGAAGPWSVCVNVPADVQSIPPSAPVYNVKYVYVYDSTPEVVYVGYTPGYYGSYAYGGCVVYGTGYWYRPWYGYYYYPRPVTYGFSVHYSPWGGWGFSYGVSYGWFHVGFGGHRGGWWGPSGYHHGYRHGYHRGYRHGYSHGARAGYRAGYHAGQRQSASPNLYNKRDGVRHTGDRQRPATADQRTAAANRKGTSTRPATGDVSRTSTANKKATQGGAATRDRQGTQAKPQTRESQQLKGGSQSKNNVYSDKNGNVYRKSDKGWEQNSKQGWSSMDKQQRATRDKSQSQKQQQNLNKQHDARQKGSANTQSYRSGSQSKQRSSSSKSQSRSGSSRSSGSRKRR